MICMQASVTPVDDSEMSQFKELFPNYSITDKSKVWISSTKFVCM